MDTLLLVEDDVHTQAWLRNLLEDGSMVRQVVGCSSVREATAWLDAHQPDMVLTDLGLPDGSGLDVIRQVIGLYPRCEVLVLSMFGDESNVVAAIDAGAGGYLLKDGSIDNIREHLACLREGGSPLSPSIARTLINRHRQASNLMPAAPAKHCPALSEREVEVLTGVAKGFSYVEVGQMLGMSTNTVRTHIRRLYEKLSVNTRSEALMEYNRHRSAQGLPPIC